MCDSYESCFSRRQGRGSLVGTVRTSSSAGVTIPAEEAAIQRVALFSTTSPAGQFSVTLLCIT